jgi:hypothetical protein
MMLRVSYVNTNLRRLSTWLATTPLSIAWAFIRRTIHRVEHGTYILFTAQRQ